MRTAHRDLGIILAATFITWAGQRTAAIALPLVALAETGDAAATGIVAGFAGIPVVTAPWWGRRLRQRLTSGRAIAATILAQIAGVLVVPLASQLGRLTVPHLAVAGLLTGAATALAGPASRALIADVGDRVSHALTVRALTANDFMHRVSMVFAPALGAWAVARGWQLALLYVEAATLAAAAATLCLVRATGTGQPSGDDRGDALPALRAAPVLLRSMAMSVAGGFGWFSFSLGLALLGVERGTPGTLIAAGMTGYGAASIVGSFAAPFVVPRLPALPTIAVAWSVFALACAALLPLARDPLHIGLVAAVGGALMPFGIGANSALIAETTTGAARRSVFALDSALYSGAYAAGMMVGGFLLGRFGAPSTMVACGVGLLLVVGVATAWPGRRRVAGRVSAC